MGVTSFSSGLHPKIMGLIFFPSHLLWSKWSKIVLNDSIMTFRLKIISLYNLKNRCVGISALEP